MEDKEIKPFGYINEEGGLIEGDHPHPAPNNFTPLTQDVIDEMAKSIAIVNGDDEVIARAKKLYPTDLVFKARLTKNSGDEFIETGSAFEILSALDRRGVVYDKLSYVTLTNSTGMGVATGPEAIIEFLIYHSTGKRLGSVKNSPYVFECEFKNKETMYYDIHYILSRPNNAELRTMTKLTLVYRGTGRFGDKLCSNIYSLSGVMDIEHALKNWHKRSPNYDTEGQEQTDKEVESIKDLFIAVSELLTPAALIEEEPEEEEMTMEETDDRTEDIRAFAIDEQVSLVKSLVIAGDNEKALRHLEVLEFIIKK